MYARWNGTDSCPNPIEQEYDWSQDDGKNHCGKDMREYNCESEGETVRWNSISAPTSEQILTMDSPGDDDKPTDKTTGKPSGGGTIDIAFSTVIVMVLISALATSL